MSEAFQHVRESLMRELVTYRSKARLEKQRHGEPLRGQQLDFWMGNTIFWIIQLQICDEEENRRKYNEALNKAWECLDRLHTLLD